MSDDDVHGGFPEPAAPRRLIRRHVSRRIAGTADKTVIVRRPGPAAAVLFAAWMTAAGVTAAQNAGSAVGYVYPAGGQRGTKFRVTVGGIRLIEAGEARFSGKGVSATVVGHVEPPRSDDLKETRDELRKLAGRKMKSAREKRATGAASGQRSRGDEDSDWTDEDEDRLLELAEKVSAFARFREAPALADRVELEVTIAPDATPGRREIRLEGMFGLSNPLVFLVGDLPETSEPLLMARDIMATVDEGRLAQWRRFAARNEPAMPVTLPTVINGQVGPGERDHFRFSARKGQRIVIAATARELRPYVADAVPGWCDLVLAVADPGGRQVACSDHWRAHPDPVLCFEADADGEYVLEVADCLYRGREDFVYRVTIGELPFVTDFFPLGGRTDAETVVTLKGWNLPETTVVLPRGIQNGVYGTDIFGKPWLFGHGLAFSVDDLPERMESESASGGDGESRGNGVATAVNTPIVINGRIAAAGERDVYSFKGRAGQKIVAEIMARRLGSPLDSNIKVTDASGALLAYNDDHADKSAGLVTHHADSYVLVTLPADGTCCVSVADTQGKYGDAYSYRLRIGEPRPDFELRVAPSVVNLRRGATTAFAVHAIRRDGFDGEIVVSLENAPPGFALSGRRIPGGQDHVRMTLTVPVRAAAGLDVLALRGEAKIGGRRIAHVAAPADDMMQAFAWRFLVPSDAFAAFVMRGPGWPIALAAADQTVSMPVGGMATVSVNVPLKGPQGEISLELSEPPGGVTIAELVPRGSRTDIVFRAGPDAKAGSCGNLIVDAFLERTGPPRGKGVSKAVPAWAGKSEAGDGGAAADTETPPSKKRRISIGSLPAIPFEIVPSR